jgi:hypothetical protein
VEVRIRAAFEAASAWMLLLPLTATLLHARNMLLLAGLQLFQ